MTDNSPPAFAVQAAPANVHGSVPGSSGISLRDYFAAMALQGMPAFGDTRTSYARGEMPALACGLADDMLKQRAK